MTVGRRTIARSDRARRRQYVSDARILDLAQKTALSGPCRRVKGKLLGCYTTGWQNHVELGPGVAHEIRNDRSFAAHVSALFKEHARTMPPYLLESYEHTTRRYAYKAGILWMMTHCTRGTPDWDIDRHVPDGNDCHLYTAIVLP